MRDTQRSGTTRQASMNACTRFASVFCRPVGYPLTRAPVFTLVPCLLEVTLTWSRSQIACGACTQLSANGGCALFLPHCPRSSEQCSQTQRLSLRRALLPPMLCPKQKLGQPPFR